jgi:hypothetical protein
MSQKILFTFSLCLLFFGTALSQVEKDSLPTHTDTSALRIKNLNPYFTLHSDSVLRYQLLINKPAADYYWYLRNSPVGFKINKDDGTISFRADRSYFLSGRLKYDFPYKVALGVQNLNDPTDKLDTTFTIQFFNTEIIPSRVKPSVSGTMYVDEGDTITIRLQCDNGNFPIENISYYSNKNIRSLTPVNVCNDEFTWQIPYDFIREADKEKTQPLSIYFIGTNKFFTKDTAEVSLVIRDNINYPQRVMEYQRLTADIKQYILQLKSSFRIVDRKIRKNKSTRTAFDLTSASTALGGTVFSSMSGESAQTTGKILPSVGVALVPVKEATAPTPSYEQNTATLIRSAIKRLEYLLADNFLVGDRDADILSKTRKLKDELQQTQIQLIDVPVAEAAPDEKELDAYFNNPKLNKKYRMKRK